VSDPHSSASPTLQGKGGSRLQWAELPEELRRQIEMRLGAPVVAAHSEAGGFSPGLAARLRLAHGERVFVKAINAARNPHTPAIHRREAAVLAQLPPAAPVPRLRWLLDDGDWVVLACDEVDGRAPALPWIEGERDRVLAALVDLATCLTPAPAGMAPIAGRLADDFDGWRRLAAAPDPRLADVDPWVHAMLPELAEQESRWPAAAVGDTLLHCDLRADNILLTSTGVVFVDWPAACVGAAWIDLVFLLPSMAMQGGGDPEALLTGHPLARVAPAADVTAVLCALAGYFISRSLMPPPPNIPTLRQFQRAQGQVALRWLRRRWQ
jgi:aminoglycoside phosphotransferase (APT) family kinase protein